MSKLVGTQNVFDDVFVLVEASKLRMDDEIMQYEPVTKREKVFKASLEQAITRGVKDFYCPKCAPSFDSEKMQVCFSKDRQPLVGMSYQDWVKLLQDYTYMPGFRIGRKDEYVIFLGILIKKLVENGWHLGDAWHAICDDSKELGHYKDSKQASFSLENTGSREICGFCDLGNTCKFLSGERDYRIWVVGGSYDCLGKNIPLATFRQHIDIGLYSDYVLAWVVLER